MPRLHLRFTNIRLDGWFAAAILCLGAAPIFWLGAAAVGPLCAAETLPLLDDAAAADASFFPPPPPPEIRDVGDRAQDNKQAASKAASAASGGASSRDSTDDHQMWLVSTRQLTSTPRDQTGAAQVRRYQAKSGWSDSSIDELLAAEEPSAATCVLVHGNHTDRQLAVSKGFEVYRTLVRGAKAGQPVRLIVWSWPSDQIRGSFREDARIKARRTNIEAIYLANFLDRLRGKNPVSLVGYSFGARVITGSLHLLGGGTLANRQLEPRSEVQRPPMYAVLLAAAVDREWLLEGRPHGRALSAVERMVVLVNPQDRVLRWYRFVAPGERSEALGSRGLPTSLRSKHDREKLVQVNVANAVGNRHGWTNYLGSNEIVRRLQQEALVETSRRNGNRQEAERAAGVNLRVEGETVVQPGG
jgi:hypothetical protein